jgi:hypothetical protein
MGTRVPRGRGGGVTLAAGNCDFNSAIEAGILTIEELCASHCRTRRKNCKHRRDSRAFPAEDHFMRNRKHRRDRQLAGLGLIDLLSKLSFEQPRARIAAIMLETEFRAVSSILRLTLY